jgi:hypothetical protein
VLHDLNSETDLLARLKLLGSVGGQFAAVDESTMQGTHIGQIDLLEGVSKELSENEEQQASAPSDRNRPRISHDCDSSQES